MASTKEIAERFAAAAGGKEDPGVAEIFGSQVAVSHVYDDWDSPMVMDGAAMAANLGADQAIFGKIMSDFQSSDERVFAGDDGFATTRTISGTLADGTKVHYAYCAVATVVDGKITRIMAYQDREMAAAIGAAVQAMAQQTAS